VRDSGRSSSMKLPSERQEGAPAEGTRGRELAGEDTLGVSSRRFPTASMDSRSSRLCKKPCRPLGKI
jgi:hypothetical protein